MLQTQQQRILVDKEQLIHHILFVRNLPYKVNATDLYDLFGKCGTVRQIRLGSTKETRGTAFVVYLRPEEAREAQRTLSGYNLQGRYLILLPFQPNKMMASK